MKISARDLGDFWNAPGHFGKAPTPDAHQLAVFVDLNSRAIVLKFKRRFSTVGFEDIVELLGKLGKHRQKRHEECDIDPLKSRGSFRERHRGDFSEVGKKKSSAAHRFQIGSQCAGNPFLNEPVVEPDAEFIVEKTKQDRTLVRISPLDKLLQSSKFFPAGALAARFGDFGEAVCDVFEPERNRGRILGCGDFRRFKKSARPDIQCPRIGNRERAAGQESDAVTDFIRLKPLEVFCSRDDLRKPARRFFKLVAEGGEFGEVHGSHFSTPLSGF